MGVSRRGGQGAAEGGGQGAHLRQPATNGRVVYNHVQGEAQGEVAERGAGQAPPQPARTLCTATRVATQSLYQSDPPTRQRAGHARGHASGHAPTRNPLCDLGVARRREHGVGTAWAQPPPYVAGGPFQGENSPRDETGRD